MPDETTDHHQFQLSAWFLYLEKPLQELVKLTYALYERERANSTDQLYDYSFILFPMSKAYEGFVKMYLLDMGLISRKVYEGRRFRIGRSLNPDVSSNQRDQHWLYDDLARICTEDVARQIWETWLHARNRVFHFFPTESNVLTLPKLGEYIDMVAQTMEVAITCKNER